MKKLVFLFCLSIVSVVASAADRVFEPVPTGNQRVDYQDGEAFLVAQTSMAEVSVAFVPRDKKSAWVKLGVRNIGSAPITVSERSVTVSAVGTALEVMTYEDRLKEQKRQETWSAIASGLAAAGNNMAAANAGYQHSYGTYSARTNVNGYGSSGYVAGNVTTYGSYSGSTYNASAAYQAQVAANIQNQALFDRQQANAEYARKDLSARALKMNTLDPGEFVFGDVRFSLPKRNKEAPAEFDLRVELDGDPVVIRYVEKRT